MKRYEGETVVPPGLYWSPGRWELRAVSRARGVLEGRRSARYVRVPGALFPLALIAGAVLGGIYIVVAPLVGVAAVLTFAALRAWQGLRHGVHHLAALFAPRWTPGECHFCGKARHAKQ